MLLSLFAFASAGRHAVLFAGSNTWGNYRHQADIFTLYQLLKARGFADQDITVFAYDDIAQSESNPFKGQVFHTLDHVNIYPGSEIIKYNHQSVTADNFYDCLSNLPTTTSDNVFIYYGNHGGPGVLGVPDGCGEEISGITFTTCLGMMNLYCKHCFCVIEACYAGSVVKMISPYSRTYVITAANEVESAYAATWDSALGVYLTTEFGSYFFDYLEKHPDGTMEDLFNTVRSQVTQSHVCEYGDYYNVRPMKISDFVGMPNRATPHVPVEGELVSQEEATERTYKYLMTNHRDPIVRAKARIEYLEMKGRTEKLKISLEEICKEVDLKNYDKHMRARGGDISPEYYEVLKHFRSKFGHINGDDLPLLSVFVSLTSSFPKQTIIDAIDKIL